MAAFEYQAVDSRGKMKKGVIEGDTPRQVRGLLRDQGLMPTSVIATLANNKSANAKLGLSASFSKNSKGKISAAELALITRQLATLVESGLPLEESLMAVAEQCEKNRIKSMIMGVRTKVTEGYGLSETSPVLTTNSPNSIRYGSVGKPLFNVDISIADDGEILAKGPNIMIGYFNNEEATTEAIDNEG